MLISRFLFIVCLLWSPALWAAADWHALLRSPLTAERAAQIALLHNASFRADSERLGLSQADLASAGLLQNPSLETQLRGANHDAHGPNVEVALSVDVADWFLRPLRRQLATHLLEKTRLELTDSVRRLVAETQTAFYQLQAQQQSLGQLQLIVEATAAAADFAQQQRAAGNITEREALERQAALPEARLEVARAQAEIRASRETLNRLLGLAGAETDWQIDATLPALPKVERDLSQVEAQALAARGDLEADRARVSAAESAARLQKSGRLFPDGVKVGVDYEREADGTQLVGPRVEIGLPIFNAGRPETARRQAELRQAQAQMAGRVNDIRAEARAARDALLATREAAQLYRNELLPQRAAITKAAQLEYNGMLIGVYDVLRLKREQLETARAGIDALRDYWIARVRLESVLGGSPTFSQS